MTQPVTTMRRPVTTATYAVCALLLLGCSDATAPVPVAGTWILKSVDGQPLPYTLLTMTDYKYEITGWTVTLAPDGTFNGARNIRETQPTEISISSIMSSGTWTQAGSRVVLTESASTTPLTVTVGHGVMTYDETSPDPFTGVPTKFTMTFVRQ